MDATTISPWTPNATGSRATRLIPLADPVRCPSCEPQADPHRRAHPRPRTCSATRNGPQLSRPHRGAGRAAHRAHRAVARPAGRPRRGSDPSAEEAPAFAGVRPRDRPAARRRRVAGPLRVLQPGRRRPAVRALHPDAPPAGGARRARHAGHGADPQRDRCRPGHRGSGRAGRHDRRRGRQRAVERAAALPRPARGGPRATRVGWAALRGGSVPGLGGQQLLEARRSGAVRAGLVSARLRVPPPARPARRRTRRVQQQRAAGTMAVLLRKPRGAGGRHGSADRCVPRPPGGRPQTDRRAARPRLRHRGGAVHPDPRRVPRWAPARGHRRPGPARGEPGGVRRRPLLAALAALRARLHRSQPQRRHRLLHL